MCCLDKLLEGVENSQKQNLQDERMNKMLAF